MVRVTMRRVRSNERKRDRADYTVWHFSCAVLSFPKSQLCAAPWTVFEASVQRFLSTRGIFFFFPVWFTVEQANQVKEEALRRHTLWLLPAAPFSPETQQTHKKACALHSPIGICPFHLPFSSPVFHTQKEHVHRNDNVDSCA